MFNLVKIKKFSDRNVLQYFESPNSIQIYTYADLYQQSAELSRAMRCFLRKSPSQLRHSIQRINIGIFLPIHCPALIPAIVGIEHSDCASCFLDFTNNFEVIKVKLNDSHTDIVLCDSKEISKLQSVDDNLKLAFKCRLFGKECAVVQFNDILCPAKNLSNQNAKCVQIPSSKIAFYASTSGSCGDSKNIGVTYKCFMPNIASLGKIYCITEDDQIFVSSPQTFDPFMVDICLAVNHGASLVMTSHNLRCDARKLLDILFPYRKESNVSVMQITPSLFMRWSSNDIEHRVFSQTSRLRILSFGGEAFPQTSTLRKWKHWKNAPSIQIFNLYGLTEISCWAAIYEITKDDILCTRKVPIGYPMDPYTKFQVNADGELLLRSTVRKCFGSELTDEQVYDDDFEFVLHTGDLVNVENGSYYFQSRQNSVIKIYGKKFNMAAIELQTKEINHVEDAVCVHNEEQNLIMLFVKVDGNFNNVKREILEAIQSVGVRVKIVCVTKFPITKHGKICKSELLNTANDEQSMEQPIELILQQLINDTLGTTIHFSNAVESSDFRKRSKEEIHSSFIHLGGNSLKAIQIVDEFERKITHSISYLLPMLLHERFSVHDVLCRLANEKTIIKISTAVIEPEIKEITPCWKIDMGKCIDATPTVCLLKDNEAIVSVGSHSRLLYNISIKSGEFISKLELPDRIESQVTQKGSFGFFGCYDGYMYCFAIRNGSLKWKFSTGAMIKCRALLINRLLLFGNYSETNNFWCLDADTGNLMWSQKIGSKSIYANPIESENGNVVVCSLDGTVALLNSVSAKVFWYFQSEAPVFSTPTVFRNRSKQLRIVVLAVNGAMYGLNSDGEPLWNTRIEGNIFSSPQNFICSMDQNCTNVVFGSQNGNLYCYRIDADNHCTELWKFTTSASIRSNPIFMTKEHELYIGIFSSDGIVTIVNSKDGTLISQRKINGEIFSSPVIHDGNLFVGCRNNFLYSIDLKDLI